MTISIAIIAMAAIAIIMIAMARKKKSPAAPGLLAANRRARFDYDIEQKLQAGLVLLGWEIKGLRAGRGQASDSHVVFRNGEAWLVGFRISPLPSVSTHTTPEADRSRKLLLHRREIDHLRASVERKGYALVPLEVRLVKGMAKVVLGLGRGRQLHDKRELIKDRDWSRERQRVEKGLIKS